MEMFILREMKRWPFPYQSFRANVTDPATFTVFLTDRDSAIVVQPRSRIIVGTQCLSRRTWEDERHLKYLTLPYLGNPARKSDAKITSP